MKANHHPWNLRRIFGHQPVGCAGRPSRPEAGFAARVPPPLNRRAGPIACRVTATANLAT